MKDSTLQKQNHHLTDPFDNVFVKPLGKFSYAKMKEFPQADDQYAFLQFDDVVTYAKDAGSGAQCSTPCTTLNIATNECEPDLSGACDGCPVCSHWDSGSFKCLHDDGADCCVGGRTWNGSSCICPSGSGDPGGGGTCIICTGGEYYSSRTGACETPQVVNVPNTTASVGSIGWNETRSSSSTVSFTPLRESGTYYVEGNITAGGSGVNCGHTASGGSIGGLGASCTLVQNTSRICGWSSGCSVTNTTGKMLTFSAGTSSFTYTISCRRANGMGGALSCSGGWSGIKLTYQGP